MPSFVKHPRVSNGLDSNTSCTIFCVSVMIVTKPDSFISEVVSKKLEALSKKASFQSMDSNLSQEIYSECFVTFAK